MKEVKKQLLTSKALVKIRKGEKVPVRVINLSIQEKVNKSHNIRQCEPAEEINSSNVKSEPENMTPNYRAIFEEHVRQ